VGEIDAFANALDHLKGHGLLRRVQQLSVTKEGIAVVLIPDMSVPSEKELDDAASKHDDYVQYGAS
jgi:hypothetical protein